MSGLLGLAGICVGVYLMFIALDKAAGMKLRKLEEEHPECCCGGHCKCDADGDACHCHDDAQCNCERSCECWKNKKNM